MSGSADRNRLPRKCVNIRNHPVIPVSEKGRKFQVNNKSGYRVMVVDIDGCVIEKKDDKKACDYAMLIHDQTKMFFIELKGRDIRYACRQIVMTIHYFREQNFTETTGLKLFAAIVPSKNQVPRLRQSPDYIRLSKLVEDIFIKNNLLTIDI